MTNSNQVIKLSSNIVPEKRVNTEHGIIFIYRLLNYKKYLSKLGKHHIQRTVVSIILNELLEDRYILSHHKSGAPLLENKSFKEISISHSNGYFAIYLAYKKRIGVDVEVKRTINKDGLDYFLNEKEIKHTWSDGDLLSIWCAKEAYFKLMKGELKDLREEATITDISEEEITVKTADDYITMKRIEEKCYSLVYI